jgi:phosphopentomutase
VHAPDALAVRDTLADMGQTIAENFGGKIPHGLSFLSALTGKIAESAH